MEDLLDILERYGEEKNLPAGTVLCRQGTASNGVYYLKAGRLMVYLEEQSGLFPLSEITPGEMVGELGAATGWVRTATIKAEDRSIILHISDTKFRQALREIPGLAAEIVRQIGERLTAADVARVTLGRSYQQAIDRVQTLHTEKAQLEEMLRLREELANTIVHDLRNPLGVISAGLDLLEDPLSEKGQSEQVAPVMDLIGRSVRRMRYLVDTLLDIARLEAGLELRRIPVRIDELADNIMLEEHTLAEQVGISIENRIPAGLPSVMIDPNVIQRVLINLLDNALKFTPSGGDIWITAALVEGAVACSVIDTGPGIPEEERTRIFEKFTQIKGRIGARRGSGLGLAFCQMAIKAHGGSIWVEDGPEGKGSCFTFTLPTD
jgi:signal transduction histidine kinase